MTLHVVMLLFIVKTYKIINLRREAILPPKELTFINIFEQSL